MSFLEFEKPVVDLEKKIQELRLLTPDQDDVDLAEEVGKLEAKVERMLRQTYARLTPNQKVQVARHANRPHSKDYIAALFTEFTPLAGDRLYAEDASLIGGIGRFRGQSCIVMGHEKGHDTESRLKHNFGMVMPEGYRKAQRLMRLAERFHLPVVSFIDTAGAYPGIGAEERGQAEAIARAIETCLDIRTPLIAVVIGEGGSGGAVAIAAANRVLMLEHAVYSVISPEGCASILWRNSGHAAEAAAALRLTAQDLLKFGLIDQIIEEPVGGAHRAPAATIAAVGDAVSAALEPLTDRDGDSLRTERRQKFLAMGQSLPT